ncbi:MAG: polysaccharide biosynthesis C-terminal domain-containing protein, partial [Myxococcales bacterium]|nr:polysaccharide biosynthesis C-terminal domain-containing protein [Myxococcales bacterium]
QILTLGFGAFAIFGILTTVLNSLKHERASALVTAIAFGLVVLLCFLRVRGQEFGADLLVRTAWATTAGLGVATLTAAVLVRRAAGALVSPVSLLRVLVALGVAVAVGRQFAHASKLMTIVLSAVVAVVYLLILLVSRELGKDDLGTVKAVIARRAKK